MKMFGWLSKKKTTEPPQVYGICWRTNEGQIIAATKDDGSPLFANSLGQAKRMQFAVLHQTQVQMGETVFIFPIPPEDKKREAFESLQKDFFNSVYVLNPKQKES